MEYSAGELKGSGSLNKSQFLSTSDYTFFIYRVPNQTGASPNLSGSGYFTFETKRNALGNYSGSTSYINGASLNPSVANSSNTASFGVKTLVSSSFIFSYDLFETTNSLYSATSSFQFRPGSNIPLNSVYFRATGDYEMEVQPETQTCGLQQQFQGGQNYPTQLQSILDTSTGTTVVLTVRTGTTIPDRWVSTLGGTQVLDTGYICPSNNAGIGQPGRANFTQSLQGRIAPEGGTYPLPPGGTAPNIIESDGYPRINTFTPDGPPPIIDNTTFSFTKNTVASVLNTSVYGPQTGTFWTNTVACPV